MCNAGQVLALSALQLNPASDSAITLADGDGVPLKPPERADDPYRSNLAVGVCPDTRRLAGFLMPAYLKERTWRSEPAS